MGQTQSIQKCNYEDVLSFISGQYSNSTNKIIINTLPEGEQTCLIKNTISYNKEEEFMNHSLHNNKSIKIIIYGKNSNDQTIYDKYKKIYELGFTNVYLYIGGLFEWLCLQDIYGFENFPTTMKELDILKFKSKSSILDNLIL
jgi:23S rRNA pseudoU1915 N3-methylase RlmH